MLQLLLMLYLLLRMLFLVAAAGNSQQLDHWFRLQSGADLPDLLERVEVLLDHVDFSYKNPDRLRAVFEALTHNSSHHFHRPDGKGYRLLAEVVVKVSRQFVWPL